MTAKSKREDRYLNMKGPYYYVQVAVPVGLRDRFGPLVQRSLRTKNLEEARVRRDAVVEEIQATFGRALECAELTDADIEAAALSQFRETWEWVTKERDTLFDEVPDQGWQGQIYVGLINDMLGDEDYSSVESRVEHVLRDRGLTATEETRTKLARELLLAQRDAIAAALALHERIAGPPAPPRRPTQQEVERIFARVSPVGAEDTTVGAVIEVYRAAKRTKWNAKTDRRVARVSKFFCDYVGHDTSLAGVTSADARGFLETVGRLPGGYGKHREADELLLSELVERYGVENGLSKATLKRYALVLHAMFEWARGRGAFSGANPFEGFPA